MKSNNKKANKEELFLKKDSRTSMDLLKEIVSYIKAHDNTTENRQETKRLIAISKTKYENFALEMFIEGMVAYDNVFEHIKNFNNRLYRLEELMEARNYRPSNQ